MASDPTRLALERNRAGHISDGDALAPSDRITGCTAEHGSERRRFSSRILPAYARRSPKVSEVLPILYLRGLSTGDFGPALRDLLGEDASELSASSIQRLTEAWQTEHAAFCERELRFHRYAYLFRARLGGEDAAFSRARRASTAPSFGRRATRSSGSYIKRLETTLASYPSIASFQWRKFSPAPGAL